ncbi:MAG: protein-L-isoaspartate O-methyltransferase [Gammaproteobacteria bacterium]|nr:protein-L-isoaspartate O-methyltransferase [Gammaproteobacteria bacterium]
MNYEQARFNMIEQQIRPWEVLDPRILDVLSKVHREDFVPEQYRELAFADMNIPLGHSEVMMQPKVEARLLQELAPAAEDVILEVGTGSGYVTALLATLGNHIDSVEIREQFKVSAANKLADHNITNVRLGLGDAARGWRTEQRYDAIIVTGSVPILPDSFRQSLATGGRLVAIVGQPPVMEATLVTRVTDVSWSTVSLFETSLPPLVNAEAPSKFVF